jgi:RNA-binding protein 25
MASSISTLSFPFLLSAESPSEPSGKRKKLTVGEVFNQDDDETEIKKRKLTLPDSMDDTPAPSKLPTTAEEKRQYIKNLIEQIPTGKEELFAFKLDWTMVDTVS